MAHYLYHIFPLLYCKYDLYTINNSVFSKGNVLQGLFKILSLQQKLLQNLKKIFIKNHPFDTSSIDVFFDLSRNFVTFIRFA